MLIKKTKIPFKALVTIGILPSFLKKMIYRMKGYEIGKNVSIGFASVIIGKKVKIADNVKIGLITIVRGDQILIEKYATIGSFTVIDCGKIRIGEDARVNEQVIIGGMKTPASELNLGKRTIIMEYSFINTTMPVTIGDDSGVGGHCLLFTHGSWLNQLEGFPVTFAPITIGKSVWLPWRVFIMPGVEIGDKVVVGANSMISHSVPAHSLVAGSPAKIIRGDYPDPISDARKKEIFEGFLTDFIAHLHYHAINPNKSEHEQYTLISGEVKGKPFKMFICKNEIHTDSGQTNSLMIINTLEAKILMPAALKAGQMVIDIFSKQRKGSSEVGEEFAKFISRYGIRLERV